MKMLIFLLLFHPDTTNMEVEKDTSLIKRILMNTDLSVKFNFHSLAFGKQTTDQINSIEEYSKYKQYESNGIYVEGYRRPEELGYAHISTFRFMAGFDFATTIPVKQYKPELIYGINLSVERREYSTTKELRKEIINLYSTDLISQGYSGSTYLIDDDTSLVQKSEEGLSLIIPLALRFPVYKKFGLEAGTFLRLYGYYKSISEGNNITIFGPTYDLGIKSNPYFALFYRIKNRFLIQLGVDFTKTVFLSFQI